MIEARELRIGNYIYGGKDRKTPFKVLPEDFETINYFNNNYSGIQLTEEWLLKFGFNSNGFIQYDFMNWGMRIDKGLAGDGNWIVCHGFAGQYSEITQIQYVHQLQNLYFALTGQELELKDHD